MNKDSVKKLPRFVGNLLVVWLNRDVLNDFSGYKLMQKIGHVG